MVVIFTFEEFNYYKLLSFQTGKHISFGKKRNEPKFTGSLTEFSNISSTPQAQEAHQLDTAVNPRLER